MNSTFYEALLKLVDMYVLNIIWFKIAIINLKYDTDKIIKY